jgi:phytoene dehydrogenase-like protein/pimeloyl-ACP methyl ester carboxylesterase
MNIEQWGPIHDPSAPRALLVHGITSSAETMWELGEGLAAAGWAVTALDLPGHGGSAAVPSYLFADVADAIAAQVGDGFDLYVGHSLGGAIGTVLLARHPQTARRAVLIDPALLVRGEHLAGIPAALVADKAVSVEEAAAKSPKWHLHTVAAGVRATAAADVLAVRGYVDQNEWDVRAEAAQVAAPVLVLVATDGSAVAPSLITALPAANENWSFETVPESSHSLHREHPALVLQRCLSGPAGAGRPYAGRIKWPAGRSGTARTRAGRSRVQPMVVGTVVPGSRGRGSVLRRRVLVVGGGHNGLVAAILAAQTGGEVTLLEAADHLGGATVGTAVFPGSPVRLSRYSYLVSLMPRDLVSRLGIDLSLASREVSSYTPFRRAGRAGGLLVERRPGAATEESFRELTGSDCDFRAWEQFYGELSAMARVVAPALSGPMLRRSRIRDLVVEAAGAQLWTDVFEVPIGEAINRRFSDDLVRGVVATDALIGTHTSLLDESLLANRCFLYHLIGRGTGEWLVPIGGMGALADALTASAVRLGVQIVTGARVVVAAEDPDGIRVSTDDGRDFAADSLLAAVAPAVVDGWLGREAVRPVGAQLKINMLLDRLPRLASGIDPAIAFAGTTHLEEGFEQLEAAYGESAAGRIPDPIPAEVYCHSITDPSILAGHPGATLTLFGLHTPDALFTADPEGAREQAAAAALSALELHLAEPLEDCLAHDASGRPCLDIASPLDIEASLYMPGGNIFHGDLSWPWLADDLQPSIAQLFGTEVAGCSKILLAGAGTVRGGGVSGLGGQAAVDALLAG